MIRPFNLRDLALVRRLSERGTSLHIEPGLTNGLHPLRGALLSIVGGDFPTYVCKEKQSGSVGFIQLYLEEDKHHAHIRYLSSSADRGAVAGDGADDGRHAVNEDVWLPLLDQAVVDVGRRGIHSLVAEVSETGSELPILRRAGFAVYTRQDVWIIDKVENRLLVTDLKRRQPADDWEVQLLYANTVPRLVQLVEPVPPLDNGEGWVLRENDELTTFVHVHSGSVATWLRLFIHPNAVARVDEIITAALQVSSPRASHPVYCCVRRYQSWLQSHLQQAGFELWGSQAVMVKHTVHHSRKPLPELSAALEAQGVTPTAPMVQRYQPSQANGKLSH
jgi:hypothetical protein